MKKKMNESCCKCGGLKGWVGTVLWLLGCVALVLGWMSVGNVLGVFGLSSLEWFLASISLGVLGGPCVAGGLCPCGKKMCDGVGCERCSV